MDQEKVSLNDVIVPIVQEEDTILFKELVLNVRDREIWSENKQNQTINFKNYESTFNDINAVIYNGD